MKQLAISNNDLAITNDELTINNEKVTVTEVGLRFQERLSDDEWTALGHRIGRMVKASMFMIGDWLIHREEDFGGGKQGGGGKGRPAEIERRYESAKEITGLSVETLQWAARVCRAVPVKLRRRNLAFEHHKLVAKYDHAMQDKWLALAEKHNMGKRRLARSIEAGRVLTPKELEPDPNDQPIETFCVWVNRISGLYRRFLDAGYINEASPEKRAAMQRDLSPVLDIYEKLAPESGGLTPTGEDRSQAVQPISNLCLWWQENGGRDWLRTRSKDQLRDLLDDFQGVIAIVKAIQSEFQMRPDEP
jgi:hypothetical protein